ncbi:MAG: 4-hydroxy-tetrahydrodipicolinate reductase [Actinomycetota bacterium]
MIKVGVSGAGGRMGREVCRAITAEEGLELVCAIDPSYAGTVLSELLPGLESDITVSGSLQDLHSCGTEVMVDFSVAAAARVGVSYALDRGIACVVGTTGLEAGDLEDFARIADERGTGCLVAPNFAIGAVLMMEFARLAARHMPACEIVELHHDRKIDAPSGTALNTARMILEERGVEIASAEASEAGPRGLDLGGIRVHSVRLPGLMAHQEVIFGGAGQTLSIRHDTFDRASFMPGVMMAVKGIVEMKGLVLGLDKVLDV